VWATLFLRHFGTDFWGEQARPHPYHEVPEREPNEWQRMLASDVFPAFVSAQDSEKPSDAAGAERDMAMRERLLAFIHQHRQDGGGHTSGWKLAYQRHEMTTVWCGPANKAFIIAGHTSFARLSAIADIINEGAVTDQYAPYEGYGENRQRFQGAPPQFEPVDILSPAGECRVMKVHLSCGLYASSSMRRSIAQFCVIRRPRNWWGGGRREHFRGLKLVQYNSESIAVVYVLDCERMMDDPDYQEQAFRELHGMLGEAKGLRDGLFVNLHLVNPRSVDDVGAIRKRLKIPIFTSPGHSCPYYAGPVVFVVTVFTMSDNETSEEREVRESRVKGAFEWLTKQPSSRPHWHSPRGQEGMWLCALSDQRAKEQRARDREIASWY